ncbi:MAG: hypothetical protein M5U34_35810 [Chloroflexi bacterium]|nr:hypothetical protein [Chloroflexota bacterium]
MRRIALAKQYIPTVMVEMPILPGTLTEMKAVLLELEQLQIHSINLQEFCYPFTNSSAFNERGFKVKQRPFHILNNYWYAGGVPHLRKRTGLSGFNGFCPRAEADYGRPLLFLRK